MTGPVLIYRCPGAFGLGAAFVMVAAYAGYCQRHGMTFALDMRNFQYARADGQAAFLDAFDISASGEPAILTDLHEIDRLLKLPDRVAINRTHRLSPDGPPPGRVLDVDGGIDRKLAPWFQAAPPPHFELRPKGWLRQKVDAALAARTWRGVVGVHFRHGNGEFLQTRHDFLTMPDYRMRVARFQTEMAKQVSQIAQGRAVFVAGDNPEFVSGLVRDVPGAFTLDTPIPHVPYIEYLRAVGPERALVEAAIDLWALAACEEIVCVPSSFAEAAHILNPSARIHVLDDLKLHRNELGAHAVRAARVLLLMESENADAWRRLSTALAEQGRAVQSEACADAAIEIETTQISPDRLRNLLLAAAGLSDTIDEIRDSAAQGDYEAHAARNMARLLANAHLPDLAEALLRAVIEIRPGDVRLYLHLADVLERQGRARDAVMAAQHAVSLSPDDAQIRFALVKAMHAAGDPGMKQALAAAAALARRDRPAT